MRSGGGNRKARFALSQRDTPQLGVPAKRRPRFSIRLGDWRMAPLMSGALLVTCAAVVGLFAARLTPVSTAPSDPVQLTNFRGNSRSPSFSPDGAQVAFSWDGPSQDNYDIYVKSTRGGAPRRLTTHPARDVYPAWSPDGLQVAFTRNPGAGGAIFLVSPSGGPERKVTDVKGFCLAWTRDGKSLVIEDRSSPKEPSAIFLLSLATHRKRRLTAPPQNTDGDSDFAFSPNGHSLAFVRWSTGSDSDIYILPLGGGPLHRVTQDRHPIHGLAWTPDGRELVFSSNRGGNRDLWRIAVGTPSGAQPQKLAGLDGDAAYPAFSHARPGAQAHLAYERFVQDIGIWKASPTHLDSETLTRTPSKVNCLAEELAPMRGANGAQFSPDGGKIVFVSDRSGSPELWVCDTGKLKSAQLTALSGPQIGSPRWSPDGGRIAFDVLAAGNRDIYVVKVTEGHARRLTSEPSEEARPSWSADGRFIYFMSNRSGVEQIWKMPAAGGDAVQVTQRGGSEALESLDGKQLFYAKTAPDSGLWMAPVSQGTPAGQETRILKSIWRGYWAVSGDGIYYLNCSSASPDSPKPVEFLSFGSREITRAALIEHEVHGPGLSVTRDGRSILWTQVDHVDSDIVLAMVENFH